MFRAHHAEMDTTDLVTFALSFDCTLKEIHTRMLTIAGILT